MAHPSAPPNVTCSAVSLSPALKAGASTTVRSFSAHTHALTAFPAHITQKDKQLLVFNDLLHVLSPYRIASAETQVKLPSTTIPSHTTVKPTTVAKNTITYGPYSAVEPFDTTALRVHFEHPQAVATVTELVREIEVSHWGNVYIEEHYTVEHTGAKLTGPWSRLDYQSNPTVYARNALQAMVLDLPAPARALYYRDEIGNISTSRIKSTRNKMDVILEPRYPLFGGWKTKFTFGYSLPLWVLVSKQRGGALQLRALLGASMRDVSVDNLTVSIVLPEGASHVVADVPVADVQQWRSVKHTYLDVAGRPVVVLNKRNVVTEHNAIFTVTYRFSFLSMLREPALLIAGWCDD